jgi:Sigma-70, region 4
MARIDDLPADQRAALQLLLKQGRSYDEIAQLLRIDESAVRERARAALDHLGPDDVEDLTLEQQDEIADYLLGQQSASRRAATRELLETSAPGRAWARVVAGELRPLAGDDLPEIPAEAAEVDEAFDALQARTTHRERTQRSSRVGGAILLAGLAIGLVVAILAIAGVFSGDDGDDDGGGTRTTATTSTQAQPQVEAQINLTPPEGQGGDAAAVAQIARQGDQRAVALVAQGLQQASENRFYAIWLYTSPTRAKFLGFPNPQPTSNGRMETGFALPNDANQYRELVVTRETQEEPKQPGTIVLRGALRQQQQDGG